VRESGQYSNPDHAERSRSRAEDQKRAYGEGNTGAYGEKEAEKRSNDMIAHVCAIYFTEQGGTSILRGFEAPTIMELNGGPQSIVARKLGDFKEVPSSSCIVLVNT
jgi:hypothetical protein